MHCTHSILEVAVIIHPHKNGHGIKYHLPIVVCNFMTQPYFLFLPCFTTHFPHSDSLEPLDKLLTWKHLYHTLVDTQAKITSNNYVYIL